MVVMEHREIIRKQEVALSIGGGKRLDSQICSGFCIILSLTIFTGIYTND